MAINPEIQAKISRMAEIKKQQESLKTEWAELEGFFLKRCQEDLTDTKRKTVAYAGAGGKVTATVAESVKIIYASYLKDIFGTAYHDAVSESVTHKLSAPSSRMLAGIWKKAFSRETVDEVISQLPCDDQTKKTLGKKLKGISYETDKKNLVSIGGFDEESAEQYAWFISEAAIWESFQRLMTVNKKEDPAAIAQVMKLIDGAVVVEETPKIAFELIKG